MELWPHNLFLMPRHLIDASHKAEGPVAPLLLRPPFEFFATPADPDAPRTFGGTLIVNDAPVADLAPVQEGFSARFARWRYSDFTLEADVPSAGWLRLYLLFDPLWEIRVDGQRVQAHRANCSCLAIETSPGAHRIELSYQPLARRLYGPACALLVLSLVAQAAVAWRFRKPEARPRIIAQRVALTPKTAARLFGLDQPVSRDAESSERSAGHGHAPALRSEDPRRG